MENEKLADNVVVEDNKPDSEATSPVATEEATEEISLENTAVEKEEPPKEVEAAKQTRKDTDLQKLISERLAKMRAADNEKISELETEIKKRDVTRLLAWGKKMGYKGETVDEIMDAIEADNSDRTVEEVRAEREAERERIKAEIENDPEVKAARKLKVELEKNQETGISGDIASTVFAELKAKNPSIQKESDIPAELFRLLGAGVSLNAAYNAMYGNKASANTEANTANKETKKPVEIGSTRTTGAAEKDFFTADEVMNMTAEEIKQNYDKIERSRKSGKWN